MSVLRRLKDRTVGAIRSREERLREQANRERLARAARRRAAALGENAADLAAGEERLVDDGVWGRAERHATMAPVLDVTLDPVSGVEDMGAFATGELGETDAGRAPPVEPTLGPDLDDEGEAFPAFRGTRLDHDPLEVDDVD